MAAAFRRRKARRTVGEGAELHQFRLPEVHETQDENEKSSSDQDLDEAENRNKPVERRGSPDPVCDHAGDGDGLEDRQDQVDDVGVVELVAVGQPAAADEMRIDARGGEREADSAISRSFSG